MGESEQSRARRQWRALEPLHAAVYFAPEAVAGCARLGTRGYWASYFALRAAPLGPVPAPIVTALFYNFHPGLVARSVPAVWELAPPQRFLQLRLDAVDAALRRLLGPDVLASSEVAEAAAIARAAAEAAPTAGRALAAANVALPWPEPAHLVLWHAQTVLREHRGDGHVAALLTGGLDPVEALVLFAADLRLDPARLAKVRGWAAQEWAEAGERLAERGLLDGGGGITGAGREVRESVEAHTDALADVPWQAVGDEAAERVVALAAPLVRTILARDGIPADNPMGLRPLVAESDEADGTDPPRAQRRDQACQDGRRVPS